MDNSEQQELKHTHITQEESIEKYRMLVEGIHDYAIFTIDPLGYIESWNPGAIRMKQYTSEEAIGSHFSMLYPDRERKLNEPMDHLHVALLEGSYRGEGMRRKKNGDLFLANVYIRPIFLEGKHIGFAKVVENLDEKNKLQDEFDLTKGAVKDLKVERELRERFVSTLTHDLRTPLAIARGSAEMILRRPEKAEKNIKRILDSIDRTDNMIKDLLDANQITVGNEIHLNFSHFDIVPIVREIAENFMLTAHIKVRVIDPEKS